MTKTDGWIKNTYPGMNNDLGRNNKYDAGAYLLFTPTDKLHMRLGLDTRKHDLHGEDTVAMTSYTNLHSFHRDMAKKQTFDVEPNLTTKSSSQDLSVTYDFSNFTVQSVTTRRVRDQTGIYDGDFSAGNSNDGLVMFTDGVLTTLTEELRLSSTNSTGLRWIGGIYLDKDKDEVTQGMQMPGAAMGSPVNMEMQSISDIDAQTQAIFGQVILPFGQHFEMTLGGRYQRINKKMDQNMYMLPVQGPFSANVSKVRPAQSLDLKKTWNTFLPKIALAWFLSDRHTAYASWSQGYMPGGFNFFSMTGGADENTFKPQRSTNYEIGFKVNLARWRFNIAAFYMDITDIHIYKSIGSLYLTDNADKAHSFGTELEATWMPIKGLELNTAVSLMKAEYDNFDLGTNPSGKNIRLDGKNMEGSPTFSSTVGASYHHSSGLYGRTDIRHAGDMYYYDNFTKDMQKADAYTVADMKLGFLYKNWDIYTFVHNVTDEKYINAFRSNGTGFAGFGTPRIFGAGLSYSF